MWTELLADADTKLLAQCEQSYSQTQMQSYSLNVNRVTRRHRRRCKVTCSQTQTQSYSLNVNGPLITFWLVTFLILGQRCVRIFANSNNLAQFHAIDCESFIDRLLCEAESELLLMYSLSRILPIFFSAKFADFFCQIRQISIVFQILSKLKIS